MASVWRSAWRGDVCSRHIDACCGPGRPPGGVPYGVQAQQAGEGRIFLWESRGYVAHLELLGAAGGATVSGVATYLNVIVFFQVGSSKVACFCLRNTRRAFCIWLASTCSRVSPKAAMVSKLRGPGLNRCLIAVARPSISTGSGTVL